MIRILASSIAAVFACGIAAAAPSASTPPAPAPKSIPKMPAPSVVLTGADLYTISHGVVPRGEILIVDGKIAALGAHVDAPAGAARVDLGGKRVYPGYIAANSAIGLSEVDAVRATNDYAEVGAINPNVRAEVAVNADSQLIAVARANGVLTVLATPHAGDDGVVTGQSALLRMDGWTWQDMTIAAPVGVNVQWPTSRAPEWLPPTVVDQIKEGAKKKRAALDQAMRDARAYESAKSAGSVKTPDLRWEAMLPVLSRKAPLLIHAETAAQIREALAFADREKVRIVLVGVPDAWRFAAELKARNVSVILGSAHNLPLRRWESYDTVYAAAGKLAAAGVTFAIANDGDSQGSSNERNLPYQAASYAAFGLGEEAALRAITLAPAEILGVADRLGSLDVGKSATLFVADGDVLDARTNVERAWIDGHEVSLASRHTRLYEKYQRKYEGKPKD